LMNPPFPVQVLIRYRWGMMYPSVSHRISGKFNSGRIMDQTQNSGLFRGGYPIHP
jgi:hypothetical protein